MTIPGMKPSMASMIACNHLSLSSSSSHRSKFSSSSIDASAITASILFYNMAQTFLARRLYKKAILWFHRSLASCGQHNDDELLLKIFHCLGYCQFRSGNLSTAAYSYNQALVLASKALDFHPTYMAAALNSAGLLLLQQQENGKMVYCLK